MAKRYLFTATAILKVTLTVRVKDIRVDLFVDPATAVLKVNRLENVLADFKDVNSFLHNSEPSLVVFANTAEEVIEMLQNISNEYYSRHNVLCEEIDTLEDFFSSKRIAEIKKVF